MTKNPWKTISNTVKYDNPWMRLSHRDVITPGKSVGIYGVVHFKNLALSIIPLDKDYNTWIVGQYRYCIDTYSWEIPEGGGLLDIEPLISAKRELLEETGISAETWTNIGTTYISNSVTDEKGFMFVAQDLSFGIAQTEDTEELVIRKIPFSEVVEMAMDGVITDCLSLTTIFKAHRLIQMGKL